MSKKETRIDTAELKRRVMDTMKQRINYLRLDCKDVDIYDRKTWNDSVKNEYKSIYSSIYNQMRNEEKRKKVNFWINIAGNGAFEQILDKYGLGVTYMNTICTKDAGAKLVKYMLENVIIPEIEETLKIKNLKPTRNVTALKQSLLDFEDVEI